MGTQRETNQADVAQCAVGRRGQRVEGDLQEALVRSDAEPPLRSDRPDEGQFQFTSTRVEVVFASL